jgi:hypothetical protein
MDEEIKDKIKELEDFYQMAINREVKMKDLKEDNVKLKNKLSKYED